LHHKREIRAISTFIAIVLILIAAIVGALLAYVWTMAPFSVVRENAADLQIIDANFPADHANSFNLTVMNPSYSIAGANITNIYIETSGNNKTSITSSDPALPLFLDKGTQQTFNCTLNWGVLAGDNLTVHVMAINGAEAAPLTVKSPAVSLSVSAFFDPSVTINSFNVSVTNNNSPINLTLNQVELDLNPVTNTSISIQNQILQPNQTIAFTCYTSWEGHVNPLVTVTTQEGFTAQNRETVGSTVDLRTSGIDFSLSDTNHVNVTLTSGASSATEVNVTRLTFQYSNTTDTITNASANPALPVIVPINQTVSIICQWNWTDASKRNINLMVTAYTAQGFVSVPLTVRTPESYVGTVLGARFDLADTGTFLVNITNFFYSLQPANVTEIDINQNATSIAPIMIVPGANGTVTCTFNWSSYVGQTVKITAHLLYNTTELKPTLTIRLPFLEIANATFYNSPTEVPYVNITLRNSAFATFNTTVTEAVISNATSTLLVIGTSGYEVDAGTEIAVSFSWNWIPYLNQNVTITVTTSDQFVVSATFKVG